MFHKFKISQIVKLRRMGFSDARTDSGSTYEVVRLMPSDETGEPTYWIKSGVVQRAVREGEITLA